MLAHRTSTAPRRPALTDALLASRHPLLLIEGLGLAEGKFKHSAVFDTLLRKKLLDLFPRADLEWGRSVV